MKHFLSCVFAATLATNAFSQCTMGGDGVSISTAITVDGNVSDWNAVIADPDNFSVDATPDMDAPIADVGRNFTKFAFTQTWTTLYLYFARAGSANNAVDALLYVDVNNNTLMETNEPVIAISWSGANGNGKVDMYNYVQANAGGDVVVGDGVDMPGSLLFRNTLGVIGRGTSDGLALEVGIPFPELYKQGSSDPADILRPTEHFKFHMSTINGSPTSVPGPNAINDNFNGCYSGLTILPAKLEYFEAKSKKAGSDLTWKVTDNEDAAKFEVEASKDGQHFEGIGVVNALQNEGAQVYTYFVSSSQTGNYYRLKITDSEGGVEYSKVLVVNAVNSPSITMKVSNPVYADLTITCESSNDQSCSVILFNTAGMIVYSQKVSIAAGSNRVMIPGSYMKVSGGYILEVIDQMNKRMSRKFVKM
jgi:hypothetical protein